MRKKPHFLDNGLSVWGRREEGQRNRSPANEETMSAHDIRSLLEAARLNIDRRPEEAVAILLRVHERQPTDPHLALGVARCYYLMANANKPSHGEALTWAQRAMELGAGPEAYLLAADIHRLGLLDDARAADIYRDAVKRYPNATAALVSLSGLVGPPDSPVTLDEAIDCLEKALAMEPQPTWVRVRLGTLYDKAGREDDALRQWSLALLASRTNCAAPSISSRSVSHTTSRTWEVPGPAERYDGPWLQRDTLTANGAPHWGLVLNRRALATLAPRESRWLTVNAAGTPLLAIPPPCRSASSSPTRSAGPAASHCPAASPPGECAHAAACAPPAATRSALPPRRPSTSRRAAMRPARGPASRRVSPASARCAPCRPPPPAPAAPSRHTA
ncbi:MAG: tetratricopeptide repeat protein [SAR202 cluster bacterium]|nr:tetratricopeptide repeat protein [SAR202 cluster bacterium]